MASRCWVPGCILDEGSSLHRLPKNNPQLIKELGFADNFVVKPSTKVCRSHFTADSFVECAGKLRFGKKITVLKEEEAKWINCCRVCLSRNEGLLVDLFKLKYDQKIEYCAGIKVHRGDNLPQKICQVCLQKVQTACEIKEKCLETDKQLREEIASDPGDKYDLDMAIEASDTEALGTEPLDAEVIEDLPPKIPKIETVVDEEFEWPKDPVADEDFEWPEDEDSPSEEKTLSNDFRRPSAEEYVCVFCEAVFLKINDKEDHMKADHAGELICRICKTKKICVKSTEICMRGHIYGLKYLCQICAKPFHSERKLQKHIAGVHTAVEKSDMLECDLCGVKMKLKTSLKRHMRSAHQKVRIFCPHTDTCPDRSYSTKNSLNIHLYSFHNVPAPFRCEVCNSGFTNISELNAHFKRCTGNKVVHGRGKLLSMSSYYKKIGGVLQCTLCPRSFPTKKHYSDHFQGYHRDNKTCAICDKTFSTFMCYRTHYKAVHLKIRKFKCEHPGCGKEFARKLGFLSHRNTHTGEKPYACEFCDYRTGDHPTLSKHRKKMHT